MQSHNDVDWSAIAAVQGGSRAEDALPVLRCFELDLSRCVLRRDDGRMLNLGREEAALLLHLLKEAHRPVAATALLALLSPAPGEYPIARMNAHLYRLRQKLILFDGRLVVSHGSGLSYHYAGPEIHTVSLSTLPRH